MYVFPTTRHHLGEQTKFKKKSTMSPKIIVLQKHLIQIIVGYPLIFIAFISSSIFHLLRSLFGYTSFQLQIIKLWQHVVVVGTLFYFNIGYSNLQETITSITILTFQLRLLTAMIAIKCCIDCWIDYHIMIIQSCDDIPLGVMPECYILTSLLTCIMWCVGALSCPFAHPWPYEPPHCLDALAILGEHPPHVPSS